MALVPSSKNSSTTKETKAEVKAKPAAKAKSASKLVKPAAEAAKKPVATKKPAKATGKKATHVKPPAKASNMEKIRAAVHKASTAEARVEVAPSTSTVPPWEHEPAKPAAPVAKSDGKGVSFGEVSAYLNRINNPFASK